MTNKELRDLLSQYPDDMDVVVFTSEDVDDGDGWHHSEYVAHEIAGVSEDNAEIIRDCPLVGKYVMLNN